MLSIQEFMINLKSTLVIGTGAPGCRVAEDIETHRKEVYDFYHSTDKVAPACFSTRMSGSSQSAGGRRVSALRDY